MDIKRRIILCRILLCAVLLMLSSSMSEYLISDRAVQREEIKLTAFNALKGSVEQIAAKDNKQTFTARNTYSTSSISSEARKPVSPAYGRQIPEVSENKYVNITSNIKTLTQPEPGGVHTASRLIYFLRILLI